LRAARELLLKLYRFDAINRAVEDQLAGRTIKAVLQV
jgi:Zn-dependent alcohol dehydrogenase